MNNVNACVGLLQLDRIEGLLDVYIQNGKYLDSQLKDVAGVEVLNYYPNSEPSFWLYTLKVKKNELHLLIK